MSDYKNDLFNILNITSGKYIFISGSGGKTSTVKRFADELSEKNKKFLISTSTKMFPFKEYGIINSGFTKDGKCIGLELSELDRIHSENPHKTFIIESDGSMGMSIKWPKQTEPVVSKSADYHIILLGLDVIGMPLNNKTFFRYEIYPYKNKEKNITAETYINVINHYLKRFKISKTVIILNKFSTLFPNEKLNFQKNIAIQIENSNNGDPIKKKLILELLYKIKELKTKIYKVIIGDIRNSITELEIDSLD